MKSFIKKHPFLTAVLASLIFGLVLVVGIVLMAFEPGAFGTGSMMEEMAVPFVTMLVIFGGFIGFPLALTAAGGHERIVKPRRLGVRHGHQVIVNRQLCVANAFEQLLEERTPRLHRSVRRFYDTCGFPVARLIRSRCAADVVYVLMKPLEWVFLAVLYLTDANPENRIAIQYTGKSLKDLEKTSI